MSATFSRIKVWSDEVLTNEDLNNEIDNILENLDAIGVGGYSTNASQMGEQTNPGGLGSEDLAESLAGELERLRYTISRIIFGADVATKKWYEPGVTSLADLFDQFTAVQASNLTNNRVVSGRKSALSNKAMHLTPVGNQPQVLLKATTTPFVYMIKGTQYTISTDTTLTVPTAPASNNLIGLPVQSIAGAEETKYYGEYGSTLGFNLPGSEVTARYGQMCAFKLDGQSEWFIGTPQTIGFTLQAVRRGFFFDNLDAPLLREVWAGANGTTATLGQLSYVFAKANGTLDSTKRLRTGPTSPTGVTGDYWFDTVADYWKRYDGATWQDATATMIGYCATNSTNCVAARSIDAEKVQSGINTITFPDLNGLSSNIRNKVTVVNGSKITFLDSPITWTPGTDMDAYSTLGNDKNYYLYMTETGATKISSLGPYDRTTDLFGYYHPYEMWRCLGQFYYNTVSLNANSGIEAVIGIESDEWAVTQYQGSTGTLGTNNNLYFRFHASPDRRFRDGNGTKTIGYRIPGFVALRLPAGATLGKFVFTNSGFTTDARVNGFDKLLLSLGSAGPFLGLNIGHPNAVLSGGAAISTASTLGTTYYAESPGGSKLFPVAELTYDPSTTVFWNQYLQMKILPKFQYYLDEWMPDIYFGGLTFTLATAGYASNEFMQMQSNSVTLPPGSYSCDITAIIVSAVATNTSYNLGLFLANGDNTTTIPTILASQYSLPRFTGDLPMAPGDAALVGSKYNRHGEYSFQLTATTQIFVVGRMVFATAGTTGLAFAAHIKRLREPINYLPTP